MVCRRAALREFAGTPGFQEFPLPSPSAAKPPGSADPTLQVEYKALLLFPTAFQSIPIPPAARGKILEAILVPHFAPGPMLSSLVVN